MKLSISAALFGGAAYVTAHGGVFSYSIGGAWYDGYIPYNPAENQHPSIQREWDTYDPIEDVSSSYLACNTLGTAGSETASIAAGDSITAYWNNWGHYIGPVLVYMAKCSGSCSSYTPSGDVWFKIDEAGLYNGTLAEGYWGMKELMDTNSTWTSTIPSNLVAGEYLIRHELIALHISNAPQFYPECGQLTVTGSGTQSPSSSYLVSFPGAYSTSDAGITVDISGTQGFTETTYDIPGPPVWTSN